MATNAQGKPAAGDFTGAKRTALAKEHAEESQRRQEEMSTASRVAAFEESTTVTDVTERPQAPVVVDEVEVVEDDGVVIRTNEDLPEVTIGGETYSFVAGRKYKVPANVSFVLEEKGRLWH